MYPRIPWELVAEQTLESLLYREIFGIHSENDMNHINESWNKMYVDPVAFLDV